MLQGFQKKKLQRWVQTQEDVVTAAIFGCLAYMPVPWANRALCQIFSSLEKNFRAGWPRNADSVRVELWARENNIEPDVLVCVDSPERTVRVIVEAKWNGGFGDNQVQKQWTQFARGECYHVLLVRKASDARAQRDLAARSHEPHILTWSEIAFGLSALEKCDIPPLAEWAGHARSALSSFGEYCFGGFAALKTQPLPDVPKEAALFYVDTCAFNWQSGLLPESLHWQPCAKERTS